jgi:TolB-like protein
MPANSRVCAARRRPANPGILRRLAAAAAVAACVGVPALRAHGQGAAADLRPTVAIMPYFNNGSVLNHADYDALGKGIADVLITELAGNSALRVIERDHVQQVLDEQNLGASPRIDKETAAKVGRIVGVHHMIFGGFIIDPKGVMRLDVRSVNVETSVVEHVETVTDKSENLLAILSTLADKLNKGLKLPPMPGGAVRPAVAPEATKPGRWRDLIIYARAEDANDKKQPAQALALYKDFLAKSPTTILALQRRRAEQKVRELSSGS